MACHSYSRCEAALGHTARRGASTLTRGTDLRRVNSDRAGAAWNGPRAVSTASADRVRGVVRDACETASDRSVDVRGVDRACARRDGAENDARIRTAEIATAAEAAPGNSCRRETRGHGPAVRRSNDGRSRP